MYAHGEESSLLCDGYSVFRKRTRRGGGTGREGKRKIGAPVVLQKSCDVNDYLLFLEIELTKKKIDHDSSAGKKKSDYERCK